MDGLTNQQAVKQQKVRDLLLEALRQLKQDEVVNARQLIESAFWHVSVLEYLQDASERVQPEYTATLPPAPHAHGV
jgi:hypothetical protein